MGFDLSSIEDYIAGHLRFFIISIVGVVLLAGILAVSVFFIAVRGAEQILVPNVVGRELTDALLEMQVKELYPRIQLRFSQTSADRGLILEQDPRAGTIVRAGRRVRLVVSQGVVVNRVENFLGRSLNDVRMDILAELGEFSLLSIREPVMYEFSSELPGTIIAQRPEPGTEISGPTTLEFVVSRGRENVNVNIPQLTGLSITDALNLISGTGINFEFTIRDRIGDERGETVVSQRPAANITAPQSTIVQLTVTTPENLAGGEVFGLFRYTIPINPHPLPVRLEAVLPTGERVRLITADYPGGLFTVPYRLPRGSVLVLSMLNRELFRETVGG